MIISKKGVSKTLIKKINLNIYKNHIQQVHSIKYLGVILDDKLKWDEHLKSLTTKLSRANGLFLKSENLFLKKILCCYIMPLLDPTCDMESQLRVLVHRIY